MGLAYVDVSIAYAMYQRALQFDKLYLDNKAGRDNDSQRIICQLVGMGSLDLTVATLAYERITASDEDIVMIDMMG